MVDPARKDLTVTLELSDMHDVVTGLELVGDSEGWDNLPPVFGALFENEDQYLVMSAPVQPAQLSDNLVEGLQIFTVGMRQARTKGWMETWEKSSLCGLWMLYECWVNVAVGGFDDVRKLADTPGSVEARQVTLIDKQGRMHIARRLRGMKPHVYTVAEPERLNVTFEPGVVEGLRDVLLEHVMWMPEKEQAEFDVVAISKWRGRADV